MLKISDLWYYDTKSYAKIELEPIQPNDQGKYYQTNPDLQVKGSFAQIPQIRKAGVG